MTGNELNELFTLRRDLRSVEELLDAVRRAADVPGVADVSGTPHAHRSRDTVGNLLAEIEDLSSRAEHLRGEIQCREAAAAAFIQGIEDTQTRLIFRLRFLRGCTWKQIARTIGGHNTVNSVKMRYVRYLKSCDAMLPDVTLSGVV
ncbi:MAG: hypothetical protein IJR72_03825 [Oscillospiraceae bacterium]|nr:hypothetical protein [Oscillospiraceae bacterium]